MAMSQAIPQNIDAYIAGFPREVRTLLNQIRKTIRAAAPKAEEKISYRMPAFTWEGRILIYFAAWKEHVAIYPAPRAHPQFQAALARYEGGKGTVKFPLDRPLPLSLISKIVKFKVQELAAKRAAAKPRRS